VPVQLLPVFVFGQYTRSLIDYFCNSASCTGDLSVFFRCPLLRKRASARGGRYARLSSKVSVIVVKTGIVIEMRRVCVLADKMS
jgi:hypothetical protein